MRLFHHTRAAVTAVGLPFLVVLLAGCDADTAAANGSARPDGPGGAGQITPVEIATVERSRISRTSVVAGQLAPIRVVGVTSQTPGALLSVTVEEGSRVRRGDLLAELDSRELRAQVRAGEASVALARSIAERSSTMFDQKFVTAAEYERDQAALALAEASLAQLQTRLGFTRITAPIDGVVTQRFVQTGDIVGGQTRLFTVADASTLVAQLPVSELEVPLLREGSDVRVTVDALGTTIPGRIRRIFPAADSANRLVPVEVAVVGGAASGLRPGYTVRVTLQLDEREGALVVPTRAVVGAAGAQSVYLIRDGRAERRRVRAGNDLDGRTEIFEGVVFGDSVVTAGNALIRDGAAVRIVQPLAPELPNAARPVAAPAPDAGARP
ncbi:MAG: efflux RND transporter periplasmic adaptor subunit [Gemmatimonadaceae bacterium]